MLDVRIGILIFWVGDMFDFVHERKRLVQVVLALIVLPFALWGVDSYQKSGNEASLAKVNGEKIGQQEFDNAMEQQRQRLREMAGPNFDASIFDKAEIKHSVLEGLVSQKLLFSEARNAGLVVSDEMMAQLIATVGAFQKDGKFDKQSYETALSAQGMTPAMFEYRVRQDLMSRQLTDALSQNGYAAAKTAENLIRLNEQQRMVAVTKMGFEAFFKEAKVEEAAVKEYYDKNPQEFQVAERAKVEFVTFSIDSLLQQVAVTDAEIQAYYNEHLQEFGTQEQRQAAHILIPLSSKGSEAERQAATSLAESVLSQLRKSPAKFADLAKQYSKDPGSAVKGGDLGLFGRGMMVKPFEESVFSLKVGEISGLVLSDFGFHIIKLVAIQPAKSQSLSEVKALVTQRIKSQHASDKFAELADKFSNTVYEQSDSLKPAAELVKGSVQSGVWLSKNQAPSETWSAKALQAVFSEDVLKNKRNTAAVEVAPNTLLAARVSEYQAATVRPLAEVAPMIRGNLLRQAAMKAASSQGAALLGQLQRGEKIQVKWNAPQSVTRSQHADISQPLAQLLFRVDTTQLPAYVGIEDGQNGYVLARVDAVKEVELIEGEKLNRYAQQIRMLTGEELLKDYLADTKKKADISMKDFAADEKK